MVCGKTTIHQLKAKRSYRSGTQQETIFCLFVKLTKEFGWTFIIWLRETTESFFATILTNGHSSQPSAGLLCRTWSSLGSGQRLRARLALKLKCKPFQRTFSPFLSEAWVIKQVPRGSSLLLIFLKRGFPGVRLVRKSKFRDTELAKRFVNAKIKTL